MNEQVIKAIETQQKMVEENNNRIAELNKLIKQLESSNKEHLNNIMNYTQMLQLKGEN